MKISLEKQTAMAACLLIRPAIYNLFSQYGANHLERTYIHLVMIDKNTKFDVKGPDTMILHQTGVAFDEDQWQDAPFPKYSREAAYLEYRRVVNHESDIPIYRRGDSVVYHDIIIGASGLQSHFNEMCALLLAITYHGLTLHYDKSEDR